MKPEPGLSRGTGGTRIPLFDIAQMNLRRRFLSARKIFLPTAENHAILLRKAIQKGYARFIIGKEQTLGSFALISEVVIMHPAWCMTLSVKECLSWLAERTHAFVNPLLTQETIEINYRTSQPRSSTAS